MMLKTNSRDLLSKILWGLLLYGLFGAFGVPAGAVNLPGSSEKDLCQATQGTSIVRPAEAQAPWAEVFPPGTAAGLATQTQDGGFVFAGQTTAAGAGGLDLWLLKLDASGTAVWQETLGTAEDDAGTLMASPGGGFIAQGWSAVSEGFWLVRLDDSGAPQWQEQVDLPPGRGEIDAAFPQDVGILLTGTAVTPLFQKTTPALVKLDDLGAILWQWVYKSADNPGPSGDTYTFSGVTASAKGAFAVTGTRIAAATEDSDLFLMMVDSEGRVVWQWAYEGEGNEVPLSLLKTDDDGFLYVGMTTPKVLGAGRGQEAGGLLLIRLDSMGVALWQKEITAASGLTGSACVDPAGGFIASGTTTSFGAGGTDVWAAALDDTGSLLWQRAYGGPGPDGGAVVPDALGGFLLQGTSAPDDQTPPDFWLAKLDVGGQIVWQRLYGSPGSATGAAERLGDGELLLGGSTTDAPGSPARAWVARVLESGGLDAACSWIQNAGLLVQDGQLQVTDVQMGLGKTDLAENLAAFALAPYSVSVTGASLVSEKLCPTIPGLIATAEADVTSGLEPLTVHFTGAASGGTGGYIYSWSFGDGGVSAEKDPVHEYVTAGEFAVTLTVTDSSSQTATDDHLLVRVTALSPLEASASADGHTGTTPFTVHFSGSATGGTAPYTYAWTFGDGGTSTDQNPSHEYATAGVFSAILTVSDSAAHTASALPLTVTVYAPLAAAASADATSGTMPLTVHFSGSATGGAAPYTYAWNFGDGGTSTDQNPSHEYGTAGAFSAVLTVTDSAFHTASAPPLSITIYAPLVASAAADTSSGTAPLTVHFTGSATGGEGPYAYAWTFGDGGTSSAPSPSHEYAAAGSYPVVLTVTDSASHSATDAHLTVAVSAPVPPPVISLMKKASPPFKIVVTGSNLQDGVRLFINGIEWTNIQWKTTTKVKILGGASLKTAVPKGVATTFRFLNPGGGEATVTWSW